MHAPRIVPTITEPVAGARPRSPWSGPELQVLRERYLAEGLAACVRLLPGRTPHTIMARATRLGLRRQKRRVREGPPTPEIDRLIGDLYRQRPRPRGSLLVLARKIGRSRGWILVRARALGCVEGRIKEPAWTSAEEALLKECAHLHLRTIQRRLLRSGYRRTATAIGIRRKRLGLSSWDADSYSAHELSQIMGLDIHVILRWITRGWLRARQDGNSGPRNPWTIRRKDLRAFLVARPMDWDHRGCDRLWLIEILAGSLGALAREAA